LGTAYHFDPSPTQGPRVAQARGGVQEPKDVIEAIAAADALEEEKDESR
jgi:hypothetical protein